jgi:hypothetical protein
MSAVRDAIEQLERQLADLARAGRQLVRENETIRRDFARVSKENLELCDRIYDLEQALAAARQVAQEPKEQKGSE